MASNQNNCLFNTKERIFYLSDNIDNNTIGILNFNLLQLIAEDEQSSQEKKSFKPKPIKIFINSFGGSVYDAWSTIDIILNSKTPIYTYCTGYAMSAGFLIFLAGHKRFATKNATLLCHQLSCWIGERFLDISQRLEELTRLQSDIDNFICKRTKIPSSLLEDIKIKKIDWYIHSEDFEKYEIATILNDYILKEE